ncbi:MAG: quinolinate synthase NadA, partial [Elusimicrobia bacterium]|nr:quinolinate synthase NadA [Elusimicrobiota bacterium]
MTDKEAIWEEMDRLAKAGLTRLGYAEAELERMAELTTQISRAKKEQDAVIPAHVYQRAEILYGVADFIGDSLKLSRLCAESPAGKIIFCGVRFMAETAKILSPEKEVFLPAVEAGCSLAESITAEDVRGLKLEYPDVPVVSYINTSAEVKAESDVIVTSANATQIVKTLLGRHPRIIFLPDEWMGRNLARDLGGKVGEEIIIWNGKCIVHEGFDPESVSYYRGMYPGVKILAHTECSPALVRSVDFAGGTGDMLKYIQNTPASSYMLVTECGLGDLARTQFPDRQFIPMCRLCPYMKATDLSRVLQTLE